MKKYFGVDIGGTDVKWAVISEDWKFLEKGEFPTPYETGEVLADRIAAVYHGRPERFAGLGVSVPGMLQEDPDGIVQGGGSLTYLDGVPLGKLLRERAGIPCFVENDGKSCALGEYSAGALRGCRVGVVLVLGTGIGGGIVIEGKVLKGSHAFAGEFSYLFVKPGNLPKRQNLLGSTYGWKSGLLDVLLKRKGLPKDTPMTGHDVFALIHGGDEVAIGVMKGYTRQLAAQIHNLQAVLDPDVVAIGGGISNQPILIEQIVKDVDQLYQSKTLKQCPKPRVVHCEHGSAANLLGAVYYCRQRMG